MSSVPNRINSYFMTFCASDICSACSNKFTSALNESFLIFVVLLIPLLISTVTFAASTNSISDVSDIIVLKSTSGHYVVTSTSSIWNTYLMRWLETVELRVNNLIDLEVSFDDSRLIRIVVSDKYSGSSEVTWSQGYVQGKFIQQLNIYDYLHSDIPQSEVALCGLFLNGYVVNRQLGMSGVGVNNIKRRVNNIKLGTAPSWLALGIARNLYPAYRAVNSREVLRVYDNGELKSVSELLNRFADSGKDNDLNGNVCGMFVLWLSRLPEHAFMFDKLFSIIAKGKPVTAVELSSIIINCDSVGEMNKLWFDWVEKQKQMVYMPGAHFPGMAEKLRKMLVVTPTERAVAGGPSGDNSMTFNELIPLRKKDWVSSCASQKNIALKLMFIGRGNDVNEVVDLYCQFLLALEKRKSKRHLAKVLIKADNAMAEFIKKKALY